MKALVTWFALAIQLTGVLIPATGLLLCLGADGHFHVEAPHEGRDCHDDDEVPAKSEGCRDVELSVAHVVDSPKIPLFVAPSPLLTADLRHSEPPTGSTDRPSDFPPFDFCARIALRSVILLV